MDQFRPNFYTPTRVSKEQDVPGQKRIPVPVSLCPGIRAGANLSGQAPLSQDVPGQNEFKNFKKMTRFPVFGHHFPVLEHPFPVLEQCFLF